MSATLSDLMPFRCQVIEEAAAIGELCLESRTVIRRPSMRRKCQGAAARDIYLGSSRDRRAFSSFHPAINYAFSGALLPLPLVPAQSAEPTSRQRRSPWRPARAPATRPFTRCRPANLGPGIRRIRGPAGALPHPPPALCRGPRRKGKMGGRADCKLRPLSAKQSVMRHRTSLADWRPALAGDI